MCAIISLCKQGKNMYKKCLLIILSIVFLYADDYYYYSNNKKIFLTPLTQSEMQKRSFSRTEQNIQYFTTQKNTTVGVSDTIIVKFFSRDDYDRVVLKYELQMLKEMYANVYLFKIKKTENIFDTVNEIYQLDSVEYAHPNFIQNVIKR